MMMMLFDRKSTEQVVVQFAILLTGSEARLDRDRNRRRKFLGYVERGTHVLIPTHPRIVIVGIVLDIAELGGIGAGGLRDRGKETVERVEAFDDGKPDVTGPIPHDSVPGIVGFRRRAVEIIVDIPRIIAVHSPDSQIARF